MTKNEELWRKTAHRFAGVIIVLALCLMAIALSNLARGDSIERTLKEARNQGIPVERVDSDHDINKPRLVVITLDEADRLYREDPRAFRKWMQEKWPAIHSSMQLCVKMATEITEAQKKRDAEPKPITQAENAKP